MNIIQSQSSQFFPLQMHTTKIKRGIIKLINPVIKKNILNDFILNLSNKSDSFINISSISILVLLKKSFKYLYF